MKTETINIPVGAKYLSDVISGLPKNVIFDKGKTGCGGTTLAIDVKLNKENYIVAVPFISLAENKQQQYPETVLSFTGGTSIRKLTEYLNSHSIKKIIVTYDSLEKLMQYIETTDYNLLVDEYHLLFTQYVFRESAIWKVLRNFEKFASYTFMTATVLEEEFILDELKHVPIIKADWAETQEVTVNSIHCNRNVKYTVKRIIDSFISGKSEGNAYIFVNSVEFIAEMVKACKLTDTNARAIWSQQNKKETGLIKGNILDSPKKINFLTSASFEGVDIYDEDGKTFIVSDYSKPHTLVDISTSFQQIAGRIRNSRFQDRMYHIYTTTRYSSSLSYDEYKEQINKDIIKNKGLIEELNKIPDEYRAQIKNVDVQYVYLEDNKFIFDPNRVLMDLFQFKITKHLYKLRYTVSDATRGCGYTVKEYNSKLTNLDIPMVHEEIIDGTFREVIGYLESFGNNISIKRFEAEEEAFEKYPFLRNALRFFGFEGIKAENYNITNIKRKMICVSDYDNHNKIVQLLNSRNQIKAGAFVSSANLKDLFAEIYSEIGIQKTPKGSQITAYYNCKEQVKTIAGKNVKGYQLMTKKIISDGEVTDSEIGSLTKAA